MTEKNRQVRREVVRNKNEIWYASYSPDLVVNKDAAAVQELFRHSEDKEIRLKKLEQLKKAKIDLIEQEKMIYEENLSQQLEKKQKRKAMRDQMQIMVNDNYMDKEFTMKREIDFINKDIER